VPDADRSTVVGQDLFTSNSLFQGTVILSKKMDKPKASTLLDLHPASQHDIYSTDVIN